MFKDFYLSEGLKFGRYEKTVSDVMKELSKSLLTYMPYLKTYSVHNIIRIKTLYKKCEDAYKKSGDIKFSNFSQLFYTTSIPDYKDPTKSIKVNFYFSLNSLGNYEGTADVTNNEILLNFYDIDDLERYFEHTTIQKKYENILVHELTHLLDPAMKLNLDKKRDLINDAEKKRSVGNDSLYYNLPWEKLAYSTEIVRAIWKHWVEVPYFKTLYKKKDAKLLDDYFKDNLIHLKHILEEYGDSIKHINEKDKRKLYKELYSNILHCLEQYKEWLKES